MLTFGCTNYARGKGFNPLIGLTALFPPLGLVVVSVLPDRCPQEPDAAMREAIRRAKAAGLGRWNGRGFRDSEAGAWGAYQQGGDGHWHPYDADGHAKGGGEAKKAEPKKDETKKDETKKQ